MILFVCTGNTCRSPMAEAILRHRLDGSAIEVASVGTLGWNDYPATPHAVQVLAERGIGLDDHISRKMTHADVEGADVIVAMTRKHAWAVFAHDDTAFERTFLLGELVRLGGARNKKVPLRDWARSIGALRDPSRPIGHAADEIADPAGEPVEVYRATADRLERQIDALVSLLVPPGR